MTVLLCKLWLAGDKAQSLALLKQSTHSSWREMCEEKHNAGVLMRRIRIIEKPYTLYTERGFEFYKHVNIPGGEQNFVVEKQDVADIDLPSGDLMMFDSRRAAVCTHDTTRHVIQQTFYDENDDISKFLQLKHDLLRGGPDLDLIIAHMKQEDGLAGHLRRDAQTFP